ncbi:ABC transporter substrate-binding protein [Vineibacter terrae]|nr:ABC transporter substrate-binding protein [Vineibacter terrae]
MILLAVLASVSGGAVAAPPPARVVSLNLCLDQLALVLAAPGQLVGVGDVSQDRHLSARWREARSLPAVRMRIEEVLALRPDLVLLDSYAPPHMAALLGRAGVRVELFPEAVTFDDGVARVRAIAAALGRESAGTALADDMRRRLAGLGADKQDTPRPLAAVWQANGFTVSSGTLPDDLLRRAGFRNLAAERGLGPFAPLPLEVLVRAAPDLLILDGSTSERPSLAEALMTHRAARHAFGETRTLVMPHSLWLCAGPPNLEALDRLVAMRNAIEHRR